MKLDELMAPLHTAQDLGGETPLQLAEWIKDEWIHRCTNFQLLKMTNNMCKSSDQ